MRGLRVMAYQDLVGNAVLLVRFLFTITYFLYRLLIHALSTLV